MYIYPYSRLVQNSFIIAVNSLNILKAIKGSSPGSAKTYFGISAKNIKKTMDSRVLED